MNLRINFNINDFNFIKNNLTLYVCMSAASCRLSCAIHSATSTLYCFERNRIDNLIASHLLNIK